MNNRRVVVTGIGAATCLGNIDSTWSGIINSKSGISRISKFDTSWLKVKIAGCVDDEMLDQSHPINPKDAKKIDSFIRYALAASEDAIVDSGIKNNDLSEEDLSRIGVIIGSGIGGLYTIEKNASELYESKSGTTDLFFIPASLINLASGQVSIKHSFRGPNHAVCTACASGTHAIGDAYRLIMYGDADVMIAGASEDSVTPLGVSGFASIRALTSKFNDDPEGASRPWDKDRSGFVIANGSGILVLEELERAKKRGAKIYAEIVGYGLTGDGYHITTPHPDGLGATNAMKMAMKHAAVDVSKISYISAHGTSTQVGDEIELFSVQRLFLEKNPKVAMSSIKSSIGHSLGAAGAIEAAISIIAMKNNIAPPTINLDNPCDEVKINLVPNHAQEVNMNYILSNSFGFGGTNASIVFKKFV